MTTHGESPRAVLTLDEALLPRSMFDALAEYSCSLPTGTTIGKAWKCNTTFGSTGYTEEGPWLLGTYERLLEPEEPGSPGPRGRQRVRIRWRKITLLDGNIDGDV